MVSHLLNIDEPLAEKVAFGLRIEQMPEKAKAAKPTKMDLEPSPALSILKNKPKSFAGRMVGVLVTDGIPGAQLQALVDAIKKEGAAVKIIAPRIGGIKTAEGKMVPADEKLDGAPSVLFDSVVLMLGDDGAKELSAEPPAKQFVSDALAHKKFIGHSKAAAALLKAAGVNDSHNPQLVAVDGNNGHSSFIQKCRAIRSWDDNNPEDSPRPNSKVDKK